MTLKMALSLIGCALVLNLVGTAVLVVETRQAAADASGFPAIEPNASGDVDYVYRAELVRVIDGDTIVLNIDLGFDLWLHDQTIRLHGIDAPEKTGVEKLEGKASRDWLQERLYEQSLSIQTIKGNAKGSFGRWLGVLFAGGVNINDEIVSDGHAVVSD